MSGGYGGWTPQEPNNGGWMPPPEPEPTVELRRPSRWDGLRGRLPGGRRRDGDVFGDGPGEGYGPGDGNGGYGGGAGDGYGGAPRPPKVRRVSWPKRILAGTIVL